MFKKYRIIHRTNAAHPEIANFVKTYHYSKSLSRGNKHVFVLTVNGHLRGVITFGEPVGARVKKTYGVGTMECKRVVLAPNAPKNTFSWFMAKCIKELKKDKSISKIISYADPEAGHEGVAYKASNYEYIGVQAKSGQAIKMKGIKAPVHLRIAYQKVQGVYTKTAKAAQAALKTGQAKYIRLKPKHIFIYNLRK